MDDDELPGLGRSTSTLDIEAEISSAVHGNDGRTLPLVGVSIEALRHYAFEDERFDDTTTTESACQHIFKHDGMPAGWTDVVSTIPGTVYSTHVYRSDEGGELVPGRRFAQLDGTYGDPEGPPPGTRSIATVLSVADPAAVGKANRFISHYWQMKFRDVVAAADRKVAQERADGVTEPIYLWLDVVSIDEHHASDYAKGFSTTFMDAIAEIGNVYLIADPWDAPIALTRIWCAWELYCCAKAGATLSVCLSEAGEDEFVTALAEGGREVVARAFAALDSSSANATNEQDLKKISTEIERTVGFQRLDAMVLEKLRGWVDETVAQRLQVVRATNTWNESHLKLLLQHLEILKSQGRKAEARNVCFEGLLIGGGLETKMKSAARAQLDLEHKSLHYYEEERAREKEEGRANLQRMIGDFVPSDDSEVESADESGSEDLAYHSPRSPRLRLSGADSSGSENRSDSGSDRGFDSGSGSGSGTEFDNERFELRNLQELFPDTDSELLADLYRQVGCDFAEALTILSDLSGAHEHSHEQPKSDDLVYAAVDDACTSPADASADDSDASYDDEAAEAKQLAESGGLPTGEFHPVPGRKGVLSTGHPAEVCPHDVVLKFMRQLPRTGPMSDAGAAILLMRKVLMHRQKLEGDTDWMVTGLGAAASAETHEVRAFLAGLLSDAGCEATDEAHTGSLQQEDGHKADEACEIYEEELAWHTDELGPRHQETLELKANYAMMLSDVKEEDERAVEMLKEAVSGKEETLGKMHYSTLSTRSNLAGALCNLYYSDVAIVSDEKHFTLLTQAQDQYEQALAGRIIQHGAEHRHTLLARFDVANMKKTMGKLDEAVHDMREVVDAARRNPEMSSTGHETAGLGKDLRSWEAQLKRIESGEELPQNPRSSWLRCIRRAHARADEVYYYNKLNGVCSLQQPDDGVREDLSDVSDFSVEYAEREEWADRTEEEWQEVVRAKWASNSYGSDSGRSVSGGSDSDGSDSAGSDW